jgi:hypothetical protein
MKCMTLNIKQFEQFDAPAGRVTPLANFDTIGRLYLSSAFTKLYEFNQGKYPAVKIYYDKEGMLIAIKPLKDSPPGAVAVRDAGAGGIYLNSRSFAVKYDFMKAEKLKPEFVGKYVVTKENVEGEGEMYIINLKEKREKI